MSNYPKPETLARAQDTPPISGVLRANPEDFRVSEIAAFQPSGEGEHCMLWVRKTGHNTAHVAEILADHAQLPAASVSWAGMKDRNAVTEQWFSIHLANKPEPDWQQLNSETIQILDAQRHQRKLKKGVLKGNRFAIWVTALKGDRDAIPARVAAIQQYGVPNYFGEQRFGQHGGNLEKAASMFSHRKRRIKRHLRGIYLSAARSLLFNAVLEQRVKDNTWNQLLPGEVCMLNDSHSIFLTQDEPDLIKRLENFDIHPTGPLWGAGELMCKAGCHALEQEVIGQFPEFARGLEKAKLKQERRALRLKPKNFTYQPEKSSVLFEFELPAGAYATAVLRELLAEIVV